MKKTIMLFAVVLFWLVSVNTWGADVTGSLQNVAEVTLKYQSVDAQNRPVELSAKLYYKDNKDVEFVVLNCHATITHNTGCPSGGTPQMAAIKYMVSENALVISPDYIGFGETSGKVHPYMCATLTARNIMDCYKAAVKYAMETGKRKFKSNYYTLNIGYSQGGAAALAFQKYMETKATDAERKLVNLRGSVCGAGPYDQQIVFDEYEKMEKIDYPVYLYYVLRGHKEAFGETTMRNMKLEECFTPEFWSYCESTLKAEMDAKETDVDKINEELKAKGFDTFYSMMNAEYKNHDSKVYRTVRKVLANSNLLADDGWVPATPIVFYHEKTGHDVVVPYAETVAAMKRFVGKCSYVDAIEDYGYDVTFNRLGMATTDKENYLWHPAVFDEIWIDQWRYPLQNTVKGLAGLTGNVRYNFNDFSHRTFGARFYAQFLAKRASMRPDMEVDDGDTSNTDIEVPNEESFAATAKTLSGNYYRLTTELPHVLPVGEYVFVQFPTDVDGFYFGHDAERCKVTLNADGEAVAYTEFTDTYDDFEAGEVYLVKCGEAMTSVLSMTAGCALPAKEVSIDWRELNIRPLNEFNGKSYATAYMPFAYEKSDVVYRAEDGGDEVLAYPAEDDIAVGTGTILVDDNAATTVLLVPMKDNPTGGSTSSCLSGKYVNHENNGYLTFGRNKAKTDVGFYKYTSTTVKAYSCYIPAGNSDAKNIVLASKQGETAINGLQASENVEIFTLEGVRSTQLRKGVNLVRKGDSVVKLYIK